MCLEVREKQKQRQRYIGTERERERERAKEIRRTEFGSGVELKRHVDRTNNILLYREKLPYCH